MKHSIDYFRHVQGAYGFTTQRDADLARLKKDITRSFKTPLIWEVVKVGAKTQEVQLLGTTNERIKTLLTKPDEAVLLGDIVEWQSAFWLVKKVDVDTRLRCSAKMNMCSSIIKWKNASGVICQVYGESEDATKYGEGKEGGEYILIPSFSLKISVPINSDTIGIRRDQRFLLGQYGVGYRPSAYKVTRLNQITNAFQFESGANANSGILEITLGEDQFKDGVDNAELGIADYQTGTNETIAEAGDIF